MKKNTSGIYQIKNLVNDKIYIGSSIHIEKRWKYHISELRANNHCNRYLQFAWNKYGEKSFKFTILEVVKDLSKIKYIEQQYIDELQPFNDNGYNLCKITNSYYFGWKLSEDTLNKLRNRNFSSEHKNKLSFYSKKRKEILQFTFDGRFIKQWDGSRDVCIKNPTYDRTTIQMACNINSKNHWTAYNYIWLYKNDYSKEILEIYKQHAKDRSGDTRIVKLSLDGEYIQVFDSPSKAVQSVNKKVSTDLIKCCNGIRSKFSGYKGIYYRDYEEHKDDLCSFLNELFKSIPRNKKSVVQLDKKYNYIKTWNSVYEIQDVCGFNWKTVVSCCYGKSRTSCGFIWLYENDYVKIQDFEVA